MTQLSKENKKKCQIFTPVEYANGMLDMCGYRENLLGKKFLENSFGTGVILIEAVKRYIKDCRDHSLTLKKIKEGLGEDIYGIEIDESFFSGTIEQLNKIVEREGINNVEWKLFNTDALVWQNEIKFDYIVGNPPYISYRELSTDVRAFLRDNFDGCRKGKFDYCYAFIERGVNFLSDSGNLVQLVPNSLYKNVFGQQLRKLLVDGIVRIIDYSGQRLFPNTNVSSTVFLYKKNYQKSHFVYEKPSDKLSLEIDRNLLESKWIFIDERPNKSGSLLRFGEFFHSAIAIATLCNGVFIVDDAKIIAYDIEKNVLKNAVSPKLFGGRRRQQIIFPYLYDKEGRLLRFSEEKFFKLFPHTAHYLDSHRARLEARNKDKGCQWFEYGRSQAIQHMYREKLLLSTVVTDSVKIQHLGVNDIPYSGIYVLAIDKYSLTICKKLLERKEFYEYVKKCGIPVNGNSVRITPKDINEWEFDRKWIMEKA